MKSVAVRPAGVYDEGGGRAPDRGGSGSAHRFALAGFALALAGGFGSPALARALSIPLEVALAAVLAACFVLLGWVVGRRVDALLEQSFEDPMTRVGNRRHWEARLASEVERATSSRMPLSIVVFDVDHLKTINDVGGHRAGDVALRVLGEVLLATCRSRDVAARLGGDEFAVLLPRTRASEAKVVAERVRAELARRRRTLDAPLDQLLTVSMGIADLDAIGVARPAILSEAADRALYAAKARGRNRVEIADATTPRPAPRTPGVIVLEERRRARSGRVTTRV